MFKGKLFRLLSKYFGSSQRAKSEMAAAPVFLPVHAHVCSTEAGCSFMGPRWLIYPALAQKSTFFPFSSVFC